MSYFLVHTDARTGVRNLCEAGVHATREHAQAIITDQSFNDVTISTSLRGVLISADALSSLTSWERDVVALAVALAPMNQGPAMEVIKDTFFNPTTAHYVASAPTSDDLEVDDNALTSESHGGCFVMAWLWVADD